MNYSALKLMRRALGASYVRETYPHPAPRTLWALGACGLWAGIARELGL